ncbi:MAG: hypothetical protein HQ510_06420 [Candidatus Marinimicrobia bacterium]|nr:hypothetical protein [Candidatus Neomarinimicrobiota bacterium]
MLFNFIAIHPATILVREEEQAVLMFTLAYFLGISLGYKTSDKFSPALQQILLPILFIIQICMIIGLPDIAIILQKFWTFWMADGYEISNSTMIVTEIVTLILLVICGTSVYAVFLPRIIQSQKLSFKKFYSIEISGSLTGLLLIPIIGTFSHSLLLTAYFIIMLILYFSAGINRTVLVMLTVIASFFIFQFDYLDKKLSTYYYQNKHNPYSYYKVEYIEYTPYHKIEVLLNKDLKRKLFLNGRIQFGENSHQSYSYYLSEYPASLLTFPNVCVLGCGSMSSVGRIGDLSEKIQIVDIDESVFNTSKKYFGKFNRLDELNNWQFQADDAKHYMANTTDRYDLILHDIPPANTRQTALTYTREFFSTVEQNLTEDGIFSISSLRSLRTEKTAYTKRLVATLTSIFDNYFILEMRNKIFFYGVTKDFSLPDKESLIQAISFKKRKNINVLMKDEIDALVQGEEVITINNLRRLIYE